jgi:hypothetical protein
VTRIFRKKPPEMIRKPSIISRIPVLTRILLAVFFVLVISLVFNGMDNEQGIILGWLAAAVLLTELTRRWRNPLYFFLLSVGSFAGAIFLSFLHEEVVYPLVEWLGGAGALQSLPMKIFHEAISFIILFFTPTGIVIGLLGAAILLIIRLLSRFHRRRVPGKT